MAVNFPDPSASPWRNPNSGVTYTYSNGVWKATSGPVNAGVSSIIAGTGISVDQATGDVTVTNTGGGGGGGGAGSVLLDDGGTKQVIKSGGLGISNGTDENITLGSDGSAIFSGGIFEIKDTGRLIARSVGTSQISPRLADDGAVGFIVNTSDTDGSNDKTKFAITKDGSLYLGEQLQNNNLSNTNKIELKASTGAATFAGNTTVGAFDTGNADTSGVNIYQSGQLSIQRSGAGNAGDKRFLMYHGTTETASITAAGSAYFKGDITTAGNKIWGSYGIDIDAGTSGSASTYGLRIIDNGVETATLFTNGKATFDSTVTAFRFDAGQGTGDGSTQLFTGRNSSGTPTSKIFSDGSATFSSTVRINHPNGSYWAADGDTMTLGDSGVTKTTLTGSGSITALKGITGGTIQGNGGFDSNGLNFRGVSGNVETFTVATNGKVTAVGGINIDVYPVLQP